MNWMSLTCIKLTISREPGVDKILLRLVLSSLRGGGGGGGGWGTPLQMKIFGDLGASERTAETGRWGWGLGPNGN